MSDTTYNAYQHYGTNAERLAFVPDPPSATQPIYIWYETDTDEFFIFTSVAWQGPFAMAGVIGAHAPTHEDGGADSIQLDNLAAPDDNTDLNSTTTEHGLLPKLSGVVSEFLTGTGTWAAAAGGGTHAATHSLAGGDDVDVTDLAGYPGGSTTFLRADATFATVTTVVRRQVTLIIDGGGSAITTGVKGFISLPLAGTWKKWRLLSIDTAATAGSIVIDVWKDTYTNYPPAVADTITASAKPTLSAVNKNESSTLTGWTTAFSAGDILGFNVDSVTTVTKVMLVLEFE